jgi:uncharacterized protein YoxC
MKVAFTIPRSYIMPKLCVGCGETKSKSLFFKGKVVCKECGGNANMSVSTADIASIAESVDTSTIAGSENVGVLAKVDEIHDVIPKISERLDSISHEIRRINHKLDGIQNTCNERFDTISTRLTLLEESSAKIISSNALRSLSAKYIQDESGKCTPM